MYAAITRNRFTYQRGAVAAIESKLQAGDSCIDIESNVLAHNERAFHLTRTGTSGKVPVLRLIGNTFAYNDYAVGPKTDLAPPRATSTARIANNVFFENQYDFSPELDLVAYLDLHHNLLGSGSFTGLSDNFSADPLFRDAGADDYHLLPASPAASAGDSSVVAGPDLEGAARRDPPTLGAYEVDSVSEARFPGLTCGDGIVQDAPVEAGTARYVGYETCDDEKLEPDGALRCWSLRAGDAYTPGGSFTALAGTYDLMCGVSMTGSMTCWDDVETRLKWPGPFVRVDAAVGVVCAVDESGVPTCDGLTTQLPPGPFVQTMPDLVFPCGLRATGELVCSASSSPAPDLPHAGFARASLGAVNCALRPDGRAVSWTDFNAPATLGDRRFVDIVATANTCSGLTPDRRVYCADTSGGLPQK